MTRYIYANKIMSDEKSEANKYLEIKEDGTFGKILSDIPPVSEVIDYSNDLIAPGLFDTHIHGYVSHDVMDNSFESLNAISKALLACGVTSWLPTTLTAAPSEISAVCETIGSNYKQIQGAKIRGIFIEGPFFSEKYKGAQNADYLQDPSPELLTKWSAVSGNLIKKVGLAPERKKSLAFIESARNLGIKIALGHSDASFKQVQAAVKAGARIFIHTFNAMSGIHHREPGMSGAALTLNNIYTEIIADGVHVHPEVIKLLINMRSKDEIVLVSDCMRAGGMGDGIFKLGELDALIQDNTATLLNKENLAGSVISLIECVQNIVKWKLVPLEDALKMASYNPARSLGLIGECGLITEGQAADFIVLGEDGSLKATYLDGQLRYKANK